MELSIEDKVMIVKSEHRNLAKHQRLLGFHNIINDICIDKDKIEEYLLETLSNFPPFTKLLSYSAIKSHQELIKRLYPIHLPFSDKHHLLFYLVEEPHSLMKFLYESLDCCKVLPPYKFPQVELRMSTNVDFGNKPIFYDNRCSIRDQNKELLQEQYKAMREFVERTKL